MLINGNIKHMLNKRLSISIFFPAHNEEANIAKAIEAALSAVQKIDADYEIIVVNDGSSDRTGVIAENFAKENSRIRVINHPANLGYGAAVWTGIQASTKEYIFFTDADLQFDMEELSRLTQYVPEYEVVLGYRAKRQDSFMRLLNAYGWNVLNRILFGLKVKDIDCAFKLFKNEIVKILPTESRGAMLSAEILIQLQKKRIKFKEVPVTHLPRTAGSPTGAKPSVIFRAFREMMRVYKRGVTAR